MTSNGIVVDHLETGVRYAISEANFDEKVVRKVRDLRQDESVASYRPKPRQAQGSGEAGSQPQDEQRKASDETAEEAQAPGELAAPTPEELAQRSTSHDEGDASADVPTTE
jgi:hypothetical protein